MKYLLIDGSNLVREIYGFNREEAKKEGYRTDTANSSLFVSIFKRFMKRCRRLTVFCNRGDSFVEIYFDGKPRNILSTQSGALACICSGARTSDERILDRITGLSGSARRQVLLLTFDRALASQSRGLGAHVIDPAGIIAKIEQAGLNLHAYA